MRISIESISINHEIISFIIENNLILESCEISCNQYYDLIISGNYMDLYEYLLRFGYIDEFQDKEMILGDLEEYFMD